MQETSAPRSVPDLLVFDTPIAIVGGGTVDSKALQDLAANGLALIGADGGADAIGAAGLVPSAIIGDLDSLENRHAWESRTRVLHIPEQITTDFQKALYSTQAPVTLVLGMIGGRLDHTLAALSAVLEYAPRRRLVVLDTVDVALAVTGPIAFQAEQGERISIHPLLPIRFTRSTGLFYPMDGLTLAPGALIGTSNQGTGGQVEIEPEDATPWLLILPKERLWDLLALL